MRPTTSAGCGEPAGCTVQGAPQRAAAGAPICTALAPFQHIHPPGLPACLSPSRSVEALAIMQQPPMRSFDTSLQQEPHIYRMIEVRPLRCAACSTRVRAHDPALVHLSLPVLQSCLQPDPRLTGCHFCEGSGALEPLGSSRAGRLHVHVHVPCCPWLCRLLVCCCWSCCLLRAHKLLPVTVDALSAYLSHMRDQPCFGPSLCVCAGCQPLRRGAEAHHQRKVRRRNHERWVSWLCRLGAGAACPASAAQPGLWLTGTKSAASCRVLLPHAHQAGCCAGHLLMLQCALPFIVPIPPPQLDPLASCPNCWLPEPTALPAAIDFFVTVDKITGKQGEARVVITFNGKVSGQHNLCHPRAIRCWWCWCGC